VGNGFDTPEDIALLVRGVVADMQKDSAVAPIPFPGPQGAFPEDILLRPPPVVVDANILRNDIRRLPDGAADRPGHRRECRPYPPVLRPARPRRGDRAQRRVDRDRAGHPRRLPPLVDYLPLIRLVPIGDEHMVWLGPAELARVRHLAHLAQDRDDVPSAVLALLLGRFSCRGRQAPARGLRRRGPVRPSGMGEHPEGRRRRRPARQTLTLAANLTALAGQGMANGARRIAAATSPWILVAAGLGAA
jgi:hypothetical protein